MALSVFHGLQSFWAVEVSKPTIPQVKDRFLAYLTKHPTWGSLHIVLDDGNIENCHVTWCIKYAQERGDTEGAELGKILLSMSETQRRKLGHMQ